MILRGREASGKPRKLKINLILGYLERGRRRLLFHRTGSVAQL
jgi:hypothetical protein